MITRPLTGEEVREICRRRAPRYDITSHAYGLLGYRLDAYRRRGIELLALHPGDTVVEIGCGTGANFARLERAIGPTGAIGVDLSPAMLEQARSRVRRERWANVTLVESGAARSSSRILRASALDPRCRPTTSRPRNARLSCPFSRA